MKVSVIILALLSFHFLNVGSATHKEREINTGFLPSVKSLSRTSTLEKDVKAFVFSPKSRKSEDVYYLYDSANQYAGYYIVNSESIITTIYQGDYIPKCSDDLSYLPYSDSSISIKNKIATSSSKQSIPTSKLLCNPDYLFKSDIYSQSAQRYITSCPEYFNDVPGYYNIACSAVSAARLVSFYDRYSNYDLVNGLLPLKQDDNETAVHALTKELITEMHTSPTEGTKLSNERTGLKNYLNKHNGSMIQVNSGSGFDSYQDWILTSCNPALINFQRYDGQMGHSVLGIGFANIRSGNSRQNYYMVHYATADHSKSGNYIFNDADYYMWDYLYLTK